MVLKSKLRVITALLIPVVALLLWLDRGTMQRANRLYREGERGRAEELYRDRQGRPSDATTYNLGTALLSQGSSESDQHLLGAAEAADDRVRQRARYNLGYDYLTRIDPNMEADSAKQLVESSIENSRAALRLQRDDEDALWNLALAQRMRDSIDQLTESDRVSQGGQDDTPVEMLALTRSGSGSGEAGREPFNPPPASETGQRTGAADGAREAWTSQDPGPLNETEALVVLEKVTDDAELLIRGLLWSQRPDVAWWNSEPYPGGDW